jgi:hypothetical protein
MLSTNGLVNSQRWIWDNRYSLSYDTVTASQYHYFIEEGLTMCGLTPVSSPVYSNTHKIPVCEWMTNHTHIEPCVYDFVIPPGHVTNRGDYYSIRIMVMTLSLRHR